MPETLGRSIAACIGFLFGWALCSWRTGRIQHCPATIKEQARIIAEQKTRIAMLEHHAQGMGKAFEYSVRTPDAQAVAQRDRHIAELVTENQRLRQQLSEALASLADARRSVPFPKVPQ